MVASLAQQYNRRAYAQRDHDEYTGGNMPRATVAHSGGDPVKMSSRFSGGKCHDCPTRIQAGDPIYFRKSTRIAWHVECPKVDDTADRADDLLSVYDALRADQDRKAAAIRKPAAATMARKAIYRVSLTGDARRYGTDVVNVALVPDARYGSLKVSEYRGESIGVVKSDGSFMFWQTVDQMNGRVQAIKAAADVILRAADPIEFAKAFAVESAQCMRCGDDLVDEVSRARLLGPTCVKKWEA